MQVAHHLSQDCKDIGLAHISVCLPGTKAPAFPSGSPLQARNGKRRHLIFPLAGLVYNDCGNVVYLTSFSFVFVLLDLSSKIYKTSQDKNE